MSYAAIFAAASNEEFQGRCQVAMWRAAQDIIAEDRAAPNYEQRRGWAIAVLRGTLSLTPRQLAVQVLRNPTIAANPMSAQDGDLQFQVNSILADIIPIG
jgi:hypothetical protein